MSKTYQSRNVNYISGNNAMKLAGNYSAYKEEKLNNHRQVTTNNSVRKGAKKKSATGSYLYTIVFIFVIMATLAVAVLLLKAKFIVDDNSAKAIELQQQLLDIKKENTRIESKINESINIEEVYAIATNELGMIQPSNEHIKYVKAEDISYTVQYADITVEETEDISIGSVLGIITKDW